MNFLNKLTTRLSRLSVSGNIEVIETRNCTVSVNFRPRTLNIKTVIVLLLLALCVLPLSPTSQRASPPCPCSSRASSLHSSDDVRFGMKEQWFCRLKVTVGLFKGEKIVKKEPFLGPKNRPQIGPNIRLKTGQSRLNRHPSFAVRRSFQRPLSLIMQSDQFAFSRQCPRNGMLLATSTWCWCS